VCLEVLSSKAPTRSYSPRNARPFHKLVRQGPSIVLGPTDSAAPYNPQLFERSAQRMQEVCVNPLPFALAAPLHGLRDAGTTAELIASRATVLCSWYLAAAQTAEPDIITCGQIVAREVVRWAADLERSQLSSVSKSPAAVNTVFPRQDSFVASSLSPRRGSTHAEVAPLVSPADPGKLQRSAALALAASDAVAQREFVSSNLGLLLHRLRSSSAEPAAASGPAPGEVRQRDAEVALGMLTLVCSVTPEGPATDPDRLEHATPRGGCGASAVPLPADMWAALGTTPAAVAVESARGSGAASPLCSIDSVVAAVRERLGAAPVFPASAVSLHHSVAAAGGGAAGIAAAGRTSLLLRTLALEPHALSGVSSPVASSASAGYPSGSDARSPVGTAAPGPSSSKAATSFAPQGGAASPASAASLSSYPLPSVGARLAGGGKAGGSGALLSFCRLRTPQLSRAVGSHADASSAAAPPCPLYVLLSEVSRTTCLLTAEALAELAGVAPAASASSPFSVHLTIEDAHDSTVYVAAPLASLCVRGASRCSIVTGPCASLVHVESCDSCTVVAAGRAVQVRNAFDSQLHSWTPFPVVALGELRGLRLGPYAAAYPDLLAHAATARLLPFEASHARSWAKESKDDSVDAGSDSKLPALRIGHDRAGSFADGDGYAEGGGWHRVRIVGAASALARLTSAPSASGSSSPAPASPMASRATLSALHTTEDGTPAAGSALSVLEVDVLQGLADGVASALASTVAALPPASFHLIACASHAASPTGSRGASASPSDAASGHLPLPAGYAAALATRAESALRLQQIVRAAAATAGPAISPQLGRSLQATLQLAFMVRGWRGGLRACTWEPSPFFFAFRFSMFDQCVFRHPPSLPCRIGWRTGHPLTLR
jgi:hypothetical protein